VGALEAKNIAITGKGTIDGRGTEVCKNVRPPMLLRLGSRLNVFRKDQDTKQETGTIENLVIRNTEISNSIFPVSAGTESVIRLKEVSGAHITGNKAKGKSGAFVRVEGLPGSNIKLSRNRISGIGQAIIRE